MDFYPDNALYSSQRLLDYRIEDIIQSKYQILSDATDIFGGKCYEACKYQGGDRNKSYLVIQFFPWVNTANYKKESLPMEKLDSTNQTSILAVDVTGIKSFETVLKGVNQEHIYQPFSLLFQWVFNFHTKEKKIFPFLNYRNIFIRDGHSVLVMGSHFQYDHLKTEYSPYGYNLIAPDYLVPRSQNDKYHEWGDYYPIAMMLWETYIQRKIKWDFFSKKFIESVSAGIYTDFIQSFLDGKYTVQEEPLKRFQNLEFFVQKKMLASETKNSQIRDEEEEKVMKEQLEQLQRENYRLRMENSNLNQEKEKEGVENEKILKQNRLLWRIVASFLGIVFIILLILFLLGYQLISPEDIENHEITKKQKIVWNILALCQSHQVEDAKILCNELSAESNKLFYLYLQILVNIYELQKENDPEKKIELEKNIEQNLTKIKNNEQIFLEEVQKYSLPSGKESIDQLFQIYLK